MAKTKRLYSKKLWKGLDAFQCDICPANLLDEKAMRNHVYNRHLSEYVEANPPKEETIKDTDNE